jgi:hypothetical protein
MRSLVLHESQILQCFRTSGASMSAYCEILMMHQEIEETETVSHEQAGMISNPDGRYTFG